MQFFFLNCPFLHYFNNYLILITFLYMSYSSLKKLIFIQYKHKYHKLIKYFLLINQAFFVYQKIR